MKKISLIIPNYNRTELLVESFIGVLNDERIDEILICDDASPNLKDVEKILSDLKSDKINLIKQNKNLGTFFNKLEAVKNSKNDWAILLDSDNIIQKDYVDIIYQNTWDENVILCPEKLRHHKDNCWGETKEIFMDFSSQTIQKLDFQYCSKNFDDLVVLLNTGNFFINCKSYINAFIGCRFNRNVDIADVAYFNFLFLSNKNNSLKVVKDLTYIHRVHNGSFYLNNSHLSPGINNILKSIFKGEVILNT